MRETLPQSPAYASALAELPRLLKGYGETQARGRAAYQLIRKYVIAPAMLRNLQPSDAADLRKAMATAMADPEHRALTAWLAVRSPIKAGNAARH